MSARQSPVERDARKIAAVALRDARDRRADDERAYLVLEAAIRSCEQATTWAVQRDDMPAARREARAAQLLSAASSRMVARQGRDAAREHAKVGIVGGARVVAVRAGYGPNAAPVGTVLTLDDDVSSPFPYGTDDDGRRWTVWARDVEVVPDAPIPDSRTGEEPPTPHDDEWNGLGDATAAAQSEYGLALANAVIDARREASA